MDLLINTDTGRGSLMAELDTLYRLIILNLLEQSEYPLSNTRITGFMQGNSYTDYFTVQNSLSMLLESKLIRSEPTHGNTLYQITEEGRETLNFYHYKISEGIRADISAFLREHGSEIKKEIAARADYHRTPQGDYVVRCIRSEKDKTLMDLTLTVSSKEAAEAICLGWPDKNDTIFALIADELIG